MQKELALSLVVEARRVAEVFSNPERGFYKQGVQETFKLDMIIPLSESTAAVFMKKNTGKSAVMFFYHIKNYGQDDRGNPLGKWFCFFPTDSHILGMERFPKYKDKVEVANFDLNLPEGFL